MLTDSEGLVRRGMSRIAPVAAIGLATAMLAACAQDPPPPPPTTTYVAPAPAPAPAPVAVPRARG